MTPNGGAGLVPAQCWATTRVARTPRNPQDPLRIAVEQKTLVTTPRNLNSGRIILGDEVVVPLCWKQKRLLLMFFAGAASDRCNGGSPPQ